MIYMDRKTFELYQPSDVYEKANNLKEEWNNPYHVPELEDFVNDNFVQLDDLIAPIVALLNIKGYKTLYSCSGHPAQYWALYVTIVGNHTELIKQKLIEKRCDCLFTLDYCYDYHGNLAEKEPEITTIRISKDAVAAEDDQCEDDYYKRYEKHVKLCKTLYRVVKSLPDMNIKTKENNSKD